MLKFFVIHLFLCFGSGLCADCSPSDQSKSAEAVLREKLFCNYNKNIRPVKFYSNQTVVQVELYPLKIYMDEFEEKITVHGHMQYVWTDSYLQWDPKEYEDIKIITILSEEIWTPNIVVDVPTDVMKLQTNAGDCLVTHTGRVICFPVNTVNAYCSLDLIRYPFDQQNCSLIFLAPSYAGNHLNLNIFDTGVKMVQYRPNKVWEIVDISLKRVTAHATFGDNTTFYPYLRCNIIIRRHSAGQQAIIILPGLGLPLIFEGVRAEVNTSYANITPNTHASRGYPCKYYPHPMLFNFVLASLTLLTFFMDDLHQSRINVSAVTFLCNLMYCLYFGHQLPSNGDQTPLVVKFFRDSLVISGIAVAVTTLVHRIQKITNPPRNWILNFMSKVEVSPVSKLFFSRESYSGDDDAAEIIQDTKERPTVWIQLAIAVDRLIFLICLFIYLILFLFFLP